MMYQLTVSSNRQSMNRIIWEWHNKDLQNSLLFFVFSENISLQFLTVEQQSGLQPSRGEDWVGRSRDQVTDLLEHTV